MTVANEMYYDESLGVSTYYKTDGYQTKASVTFTPQEAGACWLVVVSHQSKQQSSTHWNQNIQSHIYLDNVSQDTRLSCATGFYSCHINFCVISSLTAEEHTVDAKFYEINTGNYGDVKNVRLFVIKLSGTYQDPDCVTYAKSIGDGWYSYLTGITKIDQNVTPTTTGDYLVIAGSVLHMDGSGDGYHELYSQFKIDNVTKASWKMRKEHEVLQPGVFAKVYTLTGNQTYNFKITATAAVHSYGYIRDAKLLVLRLTDVFDITQETSFDTSNTSSTEYVDKINEDIPAQTGVYSLVLFATRSIATNHISRFEFDGSEIAVQSGWTGAISYKTPVQMIRVLNWTGDKTAKIQFKSSNGSSTDIMDSGIYVLGGTAGYKVSGSLSDNARILVLKESGWSLVANNEETAPNYEITGLATTDKVLVAAVKDDGEIKAYGNITPVSAE